MDLDEHETEVRPLGDLAITVVHDNYSGADGLQTAWGFSAYVTGVGRNILFDTGSDGTLLLENMAKLRIDPAAIDVLVLSHVHGDHAGGLTGLLDVNPRIRVYLPASFPDRVKDLVRGRGAEVVEVDGPQEICPTVYSTGVLGRRIAEQAMVVRTPRGLVILTGCAHPGIARIVGQVARRHEGQPLLVMGGFHLEWTTARTVEKIIAVFREHGVRYVAPTHCCGAKARERFKQSYDSGFVAIGVGRTVTLADLP